MARAIGGAEELSGLSRQAMRLLVVGGLHAVWAAVNEHTSDGVMTNSCLEDLDDIAGIEGFGNAMQAAGWLEADEADATLTFPNFGQWNTPAKDATAAERMRKHREKQRVAQQSVTVTEPLRATVTLDKTRQDKSNTPAAPVATSDSPKRRKRSQPSDGVLWTAEAGWTGITDADRQEWAQAYPACDLAAELAKATSWLKANPTKAHKSNWRRFVVAWLTRSQDRGGTHREPGNRPGSAQPVDQAKRRFFRSDAHRSMTDEEYAIWRRDQRQGGMAVALASSLKLTEEDL
jgi:hypothetical protein